MKKYKKILAFALFAAIVIGCGFKKPYMAITKLYNDYCIAFESDIDGSKRGVEYPEWWGDEITRKLEALDVMEAVGSPEEISETVLGYAPIFEKWAPGHGGELIIHGAYDEGYALDTVDTLKAKGLIPADYVHPAAAQVQQPVAEAPTVTEVQVQPEQQPTVAESTPQPVQQPVVEEPAIQPQTKKANQPSNTVKKESTVEETVESETVVETTESEETVVESTEESVESETTTETAEESSESYETVVEENRGFPVIPVLIGVLIAGLCGAGLYFWKKQKQN